jgi:glycosyltransferase involved in cell wall biosynthesis
MDCPKLCWITGDYYIDVDIPILRNLSDHYSIHWYIIKHRSFGINVSDINLYCNKYNINLFICNLRTSTINPLAILKYNQVMSRINKLMPSIIYLNIEDFPYFHFVAYIKLKLSRTVHAAHEIKAYKGWQYKSLSEIYFKFIFKNYLNFHIFSHNLKKYFDIVYGKNTFYAPLALKDFGQPNLNNLTLDDNEIRFLFMGSIRANKGLDVLIEAVNRIYGKTKKNFKVTIVGSCTNPKYFKSHINNPEIFTLRFEWIPDYLIPDLFGNHHYLVLPYSNVAQSGPHMIAYNYNVPVIASSIPGFSERIIDKENGFLFERDNPSSLADILNYIIDQHDNIYKNLKIKLKEFAENEFGEKVVTEKYVQFFDKIVENQYT